VRIKTKFKLDDATDGGRDKKIVYSRQPPNADRFCMNDILTTGRRGQIAYKLLQ